MLYIVLLIGALALLAYSVRSLAKAYGVGQACFGTPKKRYWAMTGMAISVSCLAVVEHHWTGADVTVLFILLWFCYGAMIITVGINAAKFYHNIESVISYLSKTENETYKSIMERLLEGFAKYGAQAPRRGGFPAYREAVKEYMELTLPDDANDVAKATQQKIRIAYFAQMVDVSIFIAIICAVFVLIVITLGAL